MLFSTYQQLFYYIVFALIISIILVLISLIIDKILFFKLKMDVEKLSAFECGFQPFSNARNLVDIKFYLVAILFIIFDLEVTFIIPWALVVLKSTFSTVLVMVLFIFILTIGFIFEWVRGALDW